MKTVICDLPGCLASAISELPSLSTIYDFWKLALPFLIFLVKVFTWLTMLKIVFCFYVFYEVVSNALLLFFPESSLEVGTSFVSILFP